MLKTEDKIDHLQRAKACVRAFHAALDGAEGSRAPVLHAYLSPEHTWRGFMPFGLQVGPDALAQSFWDPYAASFSTFHRRTDIFFAGQNAIDDAASTWVVTMGHLVGLFDQPFVGIPPTQKMAFLRYAEFNRVEGDRITETAMYMDIPHLMGQAGINVFGDQTAAELVQPGPRTHDGLLFDPQPVGEGAATLDLINRMGADLGTWGLGLPLEEELRRTWAEDMIWWGPTGIGATYTIPRYAQQHSGPFRAGFTDRSSTGHIARLAEGNYGGFFGWPNFTARPTGGFMGLPGSDQFGEFRVIDIYRRDGDKLAENWVFIDLLHFWKGQGRDFFAEALSKL